MTRTTCFDAEIGQHINDFIEELLEAKSKYMTPYYGIFNDRLIIVHDNSTKDELLDLYFRKD